MKCRRETREIRFFSLALSDRERSPLRARPPPGMIKRTVSRAGRRTRQTTGAFIRCAAAVHDIVIYAYVRAHLNTTEWNINKNNLAVFAQLPYKYIYICAYYTRRTGRGANEVRRTNNGFKGPAERRLCRFYVRDIYI